MCVLLFLLLLLRCLLSAGVGKSSLISSLVSESWSERVPPVLQPVMVPPSLLPEKIGLTIIDTSCKWTTRGERHQGRNVRARSADALFLTRPCRCTVVLGCCLMGSRSRS